MATGSQAVYRINAGKNNAQIIINLSLSTAILIETNYADSVILFHTGYSVFDDKKNTRLEKAFFHMHSKSTSLHENEVVCPRTTKGPISTGPIWRINISLSLYSHTHIEEKHQIINNFAAVR